MSHAPGLTRSCGSASLSTSPSEGITAVKSNGVILWESDAIVMIATGISKASQNRKTGAMVQTWILRKDMDPVQAVHTGADSAICGECPHRGQNGQNRACYVNVGQAPLSVYRAYVAGKYPRIMPHDIPKAFAGKNVRLGAYGDPAMVPYALLESIVRNARMWTGYTHQWRNVSREYAELLMASADSLDDYRQARAAGYRAFVVVPRDGGFPLGTVECMSEARGLTCEDCGACGGTLMDAKPNAVSIAIRAHGTGAKYVRG